MVVQTNFIQRLKVVTLNSFQGFDPYLMWKITLIVEKKENFFKFFAPIFALYQICRDWGQEEKGMTEDEMAGWHHRLDGHEFEYTPGVGDGQGGLACCDSWGRKELDATELN